MADVAVKKSGIHGKGVFASRAFRKGEVVIRWDTSGEIAREQVQKLPKKWKEYVTCLDGKYILMKSPERYVNHSCEANTAARNHCDVAARDIGREEEITADYSKEAIPGLRMRCSCGSSKCRKVITPSRKRRR